MKCEVKSLPIIISLDFSFVVIAKGLRINGRVDIKAYIK